MLTPAQQTEILRLFFSQGLTRRKIAVQLKINRKSVNRVVARKTVVTGCSYRTSCSPLLEPYYPMITRLLDDAPQRSCTNMLQHLRGHGYQGGITILRDYVATIRQQPESEAFLELEFAKGEAAQVDWGEFGDVFGNGTKVHVFVMVLCWSRMLYLEFTLRETLPTLLRCYERALAFFGGRCREYWHDNMPTVVAERVGRLARFTTGFFAYAGFHGFEPILCSVGKGNEKGRVEDGVKYIKQQFWPGRSFIDIDDINRQAVQWRDTFANRREHRTTGKIPELMREQERPFLIGLRPHDYDTDDLVSCKVYKQGYIHFEGNTYSVPWTMHGKTVTVRGNDTRVRILYGPKAIATHIRCYQKGQQIRNPRHVEGLIELKGAAQRTWYLNTIRSYGPNAKRYLDIIQAGTRSVRSELSELVCLATVYGPHVLEHTIEELLTTGVVGISHIERALRLSVKTPSAPAPLSLANERLTFVPPTPNLRAYDAYLLESVTGNDDTDDQEEPS